MATVTGSAWAEPVSAPSEQTNIVNPNPSEDKVVFPELKSRATFLSKTAVVSKENQDEINKRLEILSSVGQLEMVVLLVDSVKPLTIEEYSIKLAEKWKVGKEKKDNGLILIIAAQDRKARLEVGYGLEGTITDALSSRIINEYVIPNLRNAKWDSGIFEAIARVHNLTRGLPLNAEVAPMFGGKQLTSNYHYSNSSKSGSSFSLKDLSNVSSEEAIFILIIVGIVTLFGTGVGKFILIGLVVGGLINLVARSLGEIFTAIGGAIVSGIVGYFMYDGFFVSMIAGGLFGAFGILWLFDILQVLLSIAGSSSSSSGGSGGYSGGGGSFGGGGSTGSW